MDMHAFGRELTDILAKRSLEVLRNTSASDVRNLVTGRFSRAESSAVPVAATAAALVVGAVFGASVAVLVTPVSGPEVRRRLAQKTRGARQQAMQLGESVADRVERAGHSLLENASSAIGLTSGAAASSSSSARKSRSPQGRANGQAKRASRAHAHA